MRANEQTDERVALYLRRDFCLFWTIVYLSHFPSKHAKIASFQKKKNSLSLSLDVKDDSQQKAEATSFPFCARSTTLIPTQTPTQTHPHHQSRPPPLCSFLKLRHSGVLSTVRTRQPTTSPSTPIPTLTSTPTLTSLIRNPNSHSKFRPHFPASLCNIYALRSIAFNSFRE